MVEGGGGDLTCGTNLLLNLRDQDVHAYTHKKSLHGGTCALKERKFTTITTTKL